MPMMPWVWCRLSLAHTYVVAGWKMCSFFRRCHRKDQWCRRTAVSTTVGAVQRIHQAQTTPIENTFCASHHLTADSGLQYSLLNQLVQTGSWDLSTKTLDVLRSSDVRQLSLVSEHVNHPVHQHWSVRVQAGWGRPLRSCATHPVLAPSWPTLITLGVFGSCWTCCGRQFHANAASMRWAIIPTTQNGCKLIDDD